MTTTQGFLSTQERTADTNDGFQFSGRVEQIPIVANLLKSIAFTTRVNVSVFDKGLRFTVEEGKYIQASVTISRDLFEEYVVSSVDPETEILFKIPFKELLDCVKFLYFEGRGGETFGVGSSSTSTTAQSEKSLSSLKMKYKFYGSPFLLLLDENGIITDFQIKTETYDENLMRFDLERSIVCKLILTAEPMSDLLYEFDSNNPETIRISIIPNKEIKLSCDGIAGFMTCSIPYNSEIVQAFECLSECHATYKFSVLRHSFRAMNMSQTMSIKIDETGVLCLTFLMPTKTDSFVEFYCLQNTLEEEEEDNLFN